MWRRRKEKWKDFIRKYSRNKAAVLGFIFVMILVFLALFADVICSYDKVVTQNVIDVYKRQLQYHEALFVQGRDSGDWRYHSG